MPELPEVETCKVYLQKQLVGQRIISCDVVNPKLRWPVDLDLAAKVEGLEINQISRRGKYLLFHTQNGWMLGHLGMTGFFTVSDKKTFLEKQENQQLKHLHIVWGLSNRSVLYYHDVRKFGSVHWLPFSETGPKHSLLDVLGVEPLEGEFSAAYLHAVTRSKSTSIKALIMNAHIVVGVGNIYASESLFLAKIHPQTKANKLSKAQCKALVEAIKQVLQQAIESGGSSISDFVNPDGQLGYFQHQFLVYDKTGNVCTVCKQGTIEKVQITGRSSFYCPKCQRKSANN